MLPAQDLLAMMCSLLETTINDPDLKTSLGIPATIRFRVTPLEAAPGSLPATVTAQGEGFSADALYDAENKLRHYMTIEAPGLLTWPIWDH